ncbi:MAG: DNA ligase [bacterium]|nr:DNA ligase [bacterium]
MKKELEFIDDKSSKFWKIETDGAAHTVTYGKTGTDGTSKTKEFDSEEKALADAEKLVSQKTGKGYVEPGSGSSGGDPAAAKSSGLFSGKQQNLADGETIEMQGSAAKPYTIKNVGGVYSCSCPAWRNQSKKIDRRTCKHIIKLRGAEAELERIGGDTPVPEPAAAKSDVKKPPLLLAHSWKEDIDIAGWIMSEKLDGVRAYWDGKTFYSRQGNEYCAPDWFTKDLPSFPLDGELWVGRKMFQKTVSIVRRMDAGKQWEDVRYVVFDALNRKEGFEDRVEFLKKYFADNNPAYASFLEQEVCRDTAHMREELKRVEDLGGEGLMLRKPGSLYEKGRSSTLLKVKTFHDAEAIVIEHVKGKGKHKGSMGALKVVAKGGVEFSVGTGFTDEERKNPPPIGALITYRYQELTDGGVPRFPSFLRERTDVDAEDFDR